MRSCIKPGLHVMLPGIPSQEHFGECATRLHTNDRQQSPHAVDGSQMVTISHSTMLSKLVWVTVRGYVLL